MRIAPTRPGWGSILVLTLGLATWTLSSAGSSSQTISPSEGLPIDALAETVWVEEFDVSPDGELIAFKSAKSGTYDIWTVPTAGGEPRRLTTMPGREMAPQFSPDGRWIVFQSDFGGVNVRDLYLVAADGGEPVRLTEHPLSDTSPSWSPDSTKIYFSTGMYFDSSVAVIDVRTKQITRVGSGGGAPHLSPDGNSIVLTRNPKPRDDDQSNQDIYVMSASGGDARLLTPDTFDALDRTPVWSPDSSKIAFISDRNGWNNLGVIDVETGRSRMLLTEAIEHSEPRWSPDGQSLTFTKNLDYQYHIFKIPAGGGEAVQLTEKGGVSGGSSATGQTRGNHMWHPSGGQIIYYHSDPTMTGDIWIMSASGGGERQITNHQAAALRDPDLFVWPELFEYKSFDGREVAGLVYKPKGTQAGDRLPALFFFRANSNGQHPTQWHPYVQYFVSRGYLVFAPNFRGSTGRGKEYRQSVHTHGGDHDLRDAFVGMDLLSADGWVDPDRVGAFGGSTGGFFTTTAVTKDPQRFKAGVVWYGSTDLVTLSTYGGMQGWNRFLIGKDPMENPENYYSRSIIYHADRVKVPLLFLYAQGDGAARFQQIEQYGVQAQIHGNWFDWVIYEKEPHGWYHWRPDSVERSLTAMSRMFDKFILGVDHDIKKLMEEQREGIEFRRNPTIDLWNSLVHGTP